MIYKALNNILCVGLMFSGLFLLNGCTNSAAHEVSESSLTTNVIESKIHFKGSDELKICKPLLASRFSTFDEFKQKVQIEYNSTNDLDESWVQLIYDDGDYQIESYLEAGISQDDIAKARDGGLSDRISFVTTSPSTVANRIELNKVYSMARWKPQMFGEGDVAFYDLAKHSVEHINTSNWAYRMPRDSSDKGYINTFNHVTAQAFITSCFSEEIADFVADVHELHNMPELTTGKFTTQMLMDLNTNPTDNYVDMINNECGQELGKLLRNKYGINLTTTWTPQLLVDYLNDLQRYYSWAFQIGFKPFKIDDEVIVRFAHKMNVVMQGVPIEKAH